jgi:hypothetical protein
MRPHQILAMVMTFTLILAPGAAAARALRQHTDAMTGRGIDKSALTLATTEYAEASSNGLSAGLSHSEPSLVAAASQTFPAGMSRVSTPTVVLNQGASEMPAAAFRTAAVAATAGGAAAVSLSEGMLLAEDVRAPGASRGSTLNTFNPPDAGRGAGKQGLVRLASVGVNSRPAKAYTISEMGDGPHAISHAGEAVATAFSSSEHDLRPNTARATQPSAAN